MLERCTEPRTDGTCTVTCAAGWQGGSSTLSAAQECPKRGKARGFGGLGVKDSRCSVCYRVGFQGGR